jgi:hypothetical protein
MQLSWRNKTYKFEVRKMEAKKDTYKRTNIDCSIYGFDTECVKTTERYEVQCFQLASITAVDLVYVNTGEDALLHFIDFFITTYSETEMNQECFIYGHNLSFDIPILSKNHLAFLEIQKTGIGLKEDIILYDLFDYLSYYLKLVHLYDYCLI